MGGRKNLILIIGIVLTIFSSSVFAACSSPAATEDENKTPEVVVSQLSGKVDKYNMTDAEKKLSTDLLNLIKATASQSFSEPAGISNGFQSSNFVSADTANAVNEDLVYVYVYLNDGTNMEVIQPFVQEITDQDEENAVAVAWISVNGLEELASLEEVRNIRTVIPPITNAGYVTTEGDFVHGTASVRNNYSQDGSGMKIGVISDGVDHLADSQASGDLPSDVTVLSNTYGGDEGTAMLEIIHDMVPGAKLYFHDLGGNKLAFNTAIDKLVVAGCDIIVDDIGWLDEPFFEDGIIAKHVAELIANNSVIYISSAGNSGMCHYQGVFVDDGEGYHNKIFSLPAGASFQLFLQWDDQFGSAANDYDLYVLDISGQTIAYSANTQNVTGDPLESIVTSYLTQPAYIKIKNSDGTAQQHTLEMFIYPNIAVSLNQTNLTTRDSIFGHAAVPDVIAVGAIPWYYPDTIEYFSSQGPVTIAYPVPSQRQKPDICGVDGVSTSTSGFNPFYGTSAAAPHVAAVAAQIWASNPSMTASEVRSALLSNAVDERGVVGYDTVYGYGIANSSKYFMGIATTPDKSVLIAAIKAADAKVRAAVAGTEDGQYPQTAIDVFKAAITTAQAVAEDIKATYAEVNLAVTDLRKAEAVFDAAKIVTVDITPPASVTNLMESYMGPSWIRWQWVNPKDTDFKHAMVYLNGAFVANISDSYYNATGLADGVTYEIGIQTVDTSGNINSVWITDSATTLKLPQISDFSGKDITTTSITLVWEASSETAMVEIYRDNAIIGNVSGTTSYVDSGLDSDITYNYVLIPYNKDGLAGKAVSASLSTKSSGSGSGGGSGGGSTRKKSASGGGGGGGPTGDRYENVLLKEAQSVFVTKDAQVSYAFRTEGNRITSVQFFSLKTSGNIQATIEVLKDKSSFAKSNAPGKVYQQMNIWVGKVGFVVPENVNDLKIDFKVDKSWLEENKIDTATVKLYRYADSSWKALPTSVTAEDEVYIYFESQTPGFSPFAISSETEAKESIDENMLKSVNEENISTVATADMEPSATTNPAQNKLIVILVALGAITVVLAGAYIVYRKRSKRST